MIKLSILVGSLRKDSLNFKLAKNLCCMSDDLFDSKIIPIEDLPLFNEDIEPSPPSSVLELRKAISASDAVLFITPEYNRSLPAALKNAIDWASRPAGNGCLQGKAAATIGISPGAVGTALAQTHLKGILLMLGMSVLGSPEMYIGGRSDIFDAEGKISSEDSIKFFRSFLEKFKDWTIQTKK